MKDSLAADRALQSSVLEAARVKRIPAQRKVRDLPAAPCAPRMIWPSETSPIPTPVPRATKANVREFLQQPCQCSPCAATLTSFFHVHLETEPAPQGVGHAEFIQAGNVRRRRDRPRLLKHARTAHDADAE